METDKAHLAFGQFFLLLFHVDVSKWPGETWSISTATVIHPSPSEKAKGLSGELQTSLQSAEKSLSRNFRHMKVVSGYN